MLLNYKLYVKSWLTLISAKYVMAIWC